MKKLDCPKIYWLLSLLCYKSSALLRSGTAVLLFCCTIALLLCGTAKAAPFVDNGNGTVTDMRTGLIWQQAEPGPMTWGAALSYCEGLSLGDSADWRLPNVKELESLTDDSRYGPAIDTAFFPNAYAYDYWSSTTGAGLPDGAWIVGFYYGSVGYYYKYSSYYVRCARGGQGGSPPPPPPPPGDGEIAVYPASHDFGEVIVGDESSTQQFTITNIGDTDIVVSGISISDTENFGLSINSLPCIKTYTPKTSCSFDVSFKPKSAGAIAGYVTIAGTPHSISLSGNASFAKVQLDVRAINQAHYLWYFGKAPCQAGCVPASMAMLIDYAARYYAKYHDIDIAALLQTIRERYEGTCETNAFFRYIWGPRSLSSGTVVLNKRVLHSLEDDDFQLDIGSGLTAHIDWNISYNNTNSYDDVLRRIKVGIDNDLAFAITFPVIDSKLIDQSGSTWRLKRRITEKDFVAANHMMVITGYELHRDCSHNPYNICKFIVNDTWDSKPHYIEPHRLIGNYRGRELGAFMHDTKRKYVFVLIPNGSLVTSIEGLHIPMPE